VRPKSRSRELVSDRREESEVGETVNADSR
jgi:hypothetical protein